MKHKHAKVTTWSGHGNFEGTTLPEFILGRKASPPMICQTEVNVGGSRPCRGIPGLWCAET